MARTVKEMIDEANALVPKLGFDEAQAMIAKGGVLVLDVRDAPELALTGTIAGARHVSRGMLEFRADPASPYHDADFDPARPVLVYCASGGRSALGGKVLKDMGYAQVYNIGGFKDWAEAGGAVDHPVEPGMT
ncbi:MAG: rhodanese [Rhodobacterales bacterium 32-67-9]|nr:MAG: rhodanese [Rhodobacterales bacterium 32-67-9]